MYDSPKAMHFTGGDLSTRWRCAGAVEREVCRNMRLLRFIDGQMNEKLVQEVQAVASRFGCTLDRTHFEFVESFPDYIPPQRG